MAENASVNCLICNVSISNSSIKSYPVPHCSTIIESQLNVIFIFKYIFEIKPKQLETYLRERGDPGRWATLCEKCNQDVSNLRRTFGRIHKISRQFELEKSVLQERVKCSEVGRNQSGGSSGSVTDECRKTLCRRNKRHQVPEPTNPFEDGDLKASKLARKYIDHRLHNPIIVPIVKEELELIPSPPSVHGSDSEWTLDNMLNYESSSKTGTGRDEEMDVSDESQNACDINMESSEDEYEITKVKKANRTKVKSSSAVGRRKEGRIRTRKCHRSDSIFEGRVKVPCPVCKRRLYTKKSLARFCQHFQSCALKSKKTRDLRCDLCKTWKCSSHQISEFIEHTAMCRKNETSKPLPWRHSAKKCNLCEDSCYLPFPDYIVHVYNYHRHRYSCVKCPRRFKDCSNRSSGSSLIGHYRLVHGDTQESLDILPSKQLYKTHPKETKIPLPDIPWWCSNCFQEFPDEESRDLHLTTSHDQVPELVHNCLFCGRNYFSDEELRMHRVIAHEYLAVTKPPKCKDCGEVFQSYRRMYSHRKNRHINTVFSCSTCQAKFLTNDSLSKHIQMDHEQGTVQDPPPRREGQPQKFELDMSKVTISEDNSAFLCNLCMKQFDTSHKLIRHIRRVHDKSEAKICTICGIEVSSTNSLNVHMASVHFVGDFNCDECGMVFPTEGHLKQHKLRKHSKEDVKWTCEVCGKVSISRLALYQHIRYYHQGKGKKNKS